MHSFHPSRGRIFFEVLCALTVSASCAGAWVQTGASAFLPAAFAAALYGLWHLTDMARPKAALAADVTDVAPADAGQRDVIDHVDAIVPVPMAFAAPEPELVDEKPKKAPPKRRSRKKAELVEAPVEPAAVELGEDVGPELVDAVDDDEDHHAPVVPLFEPQPLVRQPRPVFGRKAG